MDEKIETYRVNDFLLDEIMKISNGNVTIAVDFDSTLCLTDGYPNILRPNGDCFYILRKWQEMGCKIILHTMRYGKDLEDAVVWCSNCKFFFDGVNRNEEHELFDPNHSRDKMYAVFYIDDKAFGTPLLHDKFGIIKDHVDWDEIDRRYTPFLRELIMKLNKKKCLKDSNL